MEDETVGERFLRTEVAVLAERWGWREPDILRLEVQERRAYIARAAHFAQREVGQDPSGLRYREG